MPACYGLFPPFSGQALRIAPTSLQAFGGTLPNPATGAQCEAAGGEWRLTSNEVDQLALAISSGASIPVNVTVSVVTSAPPADSSDPMASIDYGYAAVGWSVPFLFIVSLYFVSLGIGRVLKAIQGF